MGQQYHWLLCATVGAMPRLVGICSIEGCEREDRITRGMCQMHYERERRSGRHGICGVDDCFGGVMARGYCGSHYYRWQNGLPLEGEWRKAGRWSDWETTSKGYVRRRMTMPDGRRRNQMQHVHIVEEFLGRELVEHEEVHHKNGVRDDNKISNLEIWNTRQPKGQRPDDKVEYALEILKLYRPDLLK